MTARRLGLAQGLSQAVELVQLGKWTDADPVPGIVVTDTFCTLDFDALQGRAARGNTVGVREVLYEPACST